MRFPLDVRRVYPDFVENCVATMEVRIFRCVLLLKAHFLFYQILGGRYEKNHLRIFDTYPLHLFLRL